MIGAIDPGKHACAFAAGENGKIIDVTYGTSPGPWGDMIFEKLYFEKPQVYPGIRNEDPNDLIDVAIGGAIFFSQFRFGSCVVSIHPREWKGTIKKEVMTRRIESRLYPDELKLVDNLRLPKETRHNALDACGILLHHFGRLEY